LGNHRSQNKKKYLLDASQNFELCGDERLILERKELEKADPSEGRKKGVVYMQNREVRTRKRICQSTGGEGLRRGNKRDSVKTPEKEGVKRGSKEWGQKKALGSPKTNVEFDNELGGVFVRKRTVPIRS